MKTTIGLILLMVLAGFVAHETSLRQRSDEDQSARIQFCLKDLNARKRLISLTKEQLFNYLGAPNPVGWGDDGYEYWSYNASPGPDEPEVHCKVLSITVNKNQKVVQISADIWNRSTPLPHFRMHQ